MVRIKNLVNSLENQILFTETMDKNDNITDWFTIQIESAVLYPLFRFFGTSTWNNRSKKLQSTETTSFTWFKKKTCSPFSFEFIIDDERILCGWGLHLVHDVVEAGVVLTCLNTKGKMLSLWF